MIRLLILTSVFLIGCSSTQELNPDEYLSGKWSFTDKGDNYEDNKNCEFFSSGKLTCRVSEFGFANGYGDGHTYKTTGSWRIKNHLLILIENPTYDLNQTYKSRYSFKSFTLNKMVLLSGVEVTQIWYKKD
jgi:hypothetical protein